jgi:hypothetical protein
VARSHAQRPGSRTAARHEHARSSSGLITALLLLLAASAAIYYATMRRAGEHEAIPVSVAAASADIQAASPHLHRTDVVAASRFARPAPARCDGRTHCSQMKSCEEAKFFIENCPGTKMDGNRDGVPCEKQWCNSGA